MGMWFQVWCFPWEMDILGELSALAEEFEKSAKCFDVPALNYEGPHKTEILKGKGEIILVVCLVDGDTSLEEKALV